MTMVMSREVQRRRTGKVERKKMRRREARMRETTFELVGTGQDTRESFGGSLGRPGSRREWSSGKQDPVGWAILTRMTNVQLRRHEGDCSVKKAAMLMTMNQSPEDGLYLGFGESSLFSFFERHHGLQRVASCCQASIDSADVLEEVLDLRQTSNRNKLK